MPRIQAPARLPLMAKLMNRITAWKYGQPFTAVGLMSHTPAYLLGYSVLSGTTSFAKTELNTHTKELVMQLVAQLNGCAFCIDIGQRFAQDSGGDLQKMQRVLEFQTHPERFTPAEQAALQYAYEVTQVTARVSDETFAALKAFYSDREIMELTVAIATENFYNRLTGPLEIESQGFCSLPART